MNAPKNFQTKASFRINLNYIPNELSMEFLDKLLGQKRKNFCRLIRKKMVPFFYELSKLRGNKICVRLLWFFSYASRFNSCDSWQVAINLSLVR